MSDVAVSAIAERGARDLRRGLAALYLAYFAMGFGFASWASRIAGIRSEFGLSPDALGLLLLAIAGGSVISLPLAGAFVDRVGTARAMVTMGLISATGLATAGVGADVDVLLVGGGLFLLGIGHGGWDVAIAVEGTSIESQAARSVMPRLVASYSVGTVVGSIVGVAMIVLGVGITPHLVGVALLIVLTIPFAAHRLIGPRARARVADGNRRHPLAAWTERRTLLLGLFVFCTAFMEGAGNDWLGVGVIDGYHASAAVGSVALGIFLTALTLGRWYGGILLARHGRLASVLVSGAVGCGGVLLIVFAGWLPAALAGAVLWGLGCALGFPIGVSVAADEPVLAAARIGVVTSISWLAFLLGPPLVGLLGSQVGTLRSLLAVVAVGVLGLLVARVVHGPEPMRTGPAGGQDV